MTKGGTEASSSSSGQHASREGIISPDINVQTEYQMNINGGQNSTVIGNDAIQSNSNAVTPNETRGVANKPPLDMSVQHNKGNGVSYARLFDKNRMSNANYKLEFMETGNGKLKFEIEDIDSIEKTYGICLLGYILSGKPPTAALFDLVRRWGPDIRFQTHDSGWIIFTFPTTELRDRILNGGSYLVFGFHLFLKEMPRCFRFREEDMNSIPVWVQIHGLPPDCWNFNILSKLASRVGKPIHMDMLTHDRKRVTFARVLVEVDTTKQKTTDIVVVLPIGDVALKFIYEQDIKYCGLCKKTDHVTADCYNANKVDNITEEINHNTTKNRPISQSVVWKNRNSRGRSRFGNSHSHVPMRSTSAATGNATQKEDMRMNEGMTVENNKAEAVSN